MSSTPPVLSFSTPAPSTDELSTSSQMSSIASGEPTRAPPPSLSASTSDSTSSTNTASGGQSSSTHRPTSSSTLPTSVAESTSSPTPPQTPSTVTSVTIIRGSSASTSTLTLSPATTLSEAVVVTSTNSSDGSEIRSTPSFVTLIETSTEADGSVTIYTEIAANPDPSRNAEPNEDPPEQSGGLLGNTGATVGVFLATGIAASAFAFLLFMLWKRRRKAAWRRPQLSGPGTRQVRPDSYGGYPFNTAGGGGGGSYGGRGNRDSGNISPLEGPGSSEKAVENDHGGGYWAAAAAAAQRLSPPQQHYRPHSTLTGNNYSGDPTSTLGLHDIGPGYYDGASSHQNGLYGGDTHSTSSRGLRSPARKPVSQHLYDDELRELDAIISKNNQNRYTDQQYSFGSKAVAVPEPTMQSLPPPPPMNAVRSRFGLAPIEESERNLPKAFGAPRGPHADEGTTLPSSQLPAWPPLSPSYTFGLRPGPSPVPSSPSLYPSTLGDNEDPYGGYDPDDADDDAKNLFYQRPPLAAGTDTVGAPPPRPPRSSLRESMRSTGTFGAASRRDTHRSIGSTNPFADAPSSNGHSSGQRPRIGVKVNISDIFDKPSQSSQGGSGSGSDTTSISGEGGEKKQREYIPLTPPLSTGSPTSPTFYEKRQEILRGKTTLLGPVRPRTGSVRSSISSE